MTIIQATACLWKGIAILAGVFLLILLKIQTPDTKPLADFSFSNHRKIPLRFTNTASKPFLYLVQTEQCLPENLQNLDVLGEPSNHDVVVLSWKDECRIKDSNLSHMHYLFHNRTSWGSGRNILYYYSLNLKKKYLYYIFMDDDLEFSFTRDMNDNRERLLSEYSEIPLRQFELFLLHFQPAIGLTHYCSVCGKDIGNDTWVEARCCTSLPKARPTPAYVPATITFDAAFNAFHSKAIHHLLPYRLDYEQDSWWESQKRLIITADVMFRGHVIKYTPVTVLNIKHRSYPQTWFNSWGDILRRVREETPKEYRNHLVFKSFPNIDMIPVITGNIIITPAWNMTIPQPREDIIPYAHMKSDIRPLMM